ncbi:MAG: methionyl-tRNA formyltransferase [Planctomycetota bacterium]
MNLVFFGSGAFGLPTLKALAKEHTVHAVVTQPDRRAGRGGKTTPTPIGAWAAEHLEGTPLFKPERVNEADKREAIRAHDADAWVVIAFGQKLGRGLLEDRFAINLHASLLPRWRGAAPINAAILAGDTTTGNSVITLADRMDAGLVLGQTERVIDPMHNIGELHDLLAEDGPRLVLDVLEDHGRGNLQPVEQDESLVTLAGKLAKTDGWIDFTESAEVAQRRVHGLTPWPGVTVEHRGEPLKLLRVGLGDPFDAPPGTLDHQGHAACAGGTSVALLEVQPPGKRPMPWADYANGRQVKAGEQLIGRSARSA